MQDVEPELQPISQLWRHVLDPHTGSMQAHMISRRAMEYPTVNPHLSGMTFLHAAPLAGKLQATHGAQLYILYEHLSDTRCHPFC